MIELCSEYLFVWRIGLNVLTCTYTFRGESTLYVFLNVKEVLAQNTRDVSSLSVSNGTLTHNQLLRKRTLNHLVKLAKRLTLVVSTYLYGAFDCMFLSCQVSVSE